MTENACSHLYVVPKRHIKLLANVLEYCMLILFLLHGCNDRIVLYLWLLLLPTRFYNELLTLESWLSISSSILASDETMQPK